MSPSKQTLTRRQATALCALAVALLLAGCSGAFDGTPDLPDGDEAAERISSVDIYNETATVESTFGNETTELRIERTVQPATGKQYQVTYRDGNRTVTVSNGTTRWVYRPAANEATRIQTDGLNTSGQIEQIRELLDSFDTEKESSGSFVPIGPSLPSDSTTRTGLYNTTGFGSEPVRTEYRGVETVSGRDTYVIEIESTEGAEQEIQQTIYFDTETFAIMRQQFNATIGDERVESRRQVQNITFDPTVNESLFEFDPPDNTTVVTTGIEEYESYAELERAADEQVPDPSVPTRLEFETGTLTEQGVSLQYINPPESLFVSRSTAAEIDDSLEQVDYQGRTYSVREQTGTTTVLWSCNDSVYAVQGNLDREAILDVADSVECPGD